LMGNILYYNTATIRCFFYTGNVSSSSSHHRYNCQEPVEELPIAYTSMSTLIN
jgi:hypothetical protein